MMANQKGNRKSLESWIGDAARSICGAHDAPKYKDYILPLIFTKRLSNLIVAISTKILENSGVNK